MSTHRDTAAVPANDNACANALRGAEVSAEALVGLRSEADGLIASRRRRVISLRPGTHRSRAHGEGMEFADLRPYEPGDDVRRIDWRVTARTGRPYTRLYQQEKDRPVLVVVDFSTSMVFGTRVAFKSVVAAGAASLLAWSAVDSGGRVGAFVFFSGGHREVRPRPRAAGALAVLQTLLCVQQAVVAAPARASSVPSPSPPPREHHATGLEAALARVARTARPGSAIFVLSDFRGLRASGEKVLARLSREADVTLAAVFDPLERRAPPPGRYRVSDGERLAVLDTAAAPASTGYLARFEARMERLRALHDTYGVRMLPIATDDGVRDALRGGLSPPRVRRRHR